MHKHTARPTVSSDGTGIATQPTTRSALDNHAPDPALCRGQIQLQRGILCDVLSMC